MPRAAWPRRCPPVRQQTAVDYGLTPRERRRQTALRREVADPAAIREIARVTGDDNRVDLLCDYGTKRDGILARDIDGYNV